MAQEKEHITLPTVLLRNRTIYPEGLQHFDVSRGVTILAIEEAMSQGEMIFLVGQEAYTMEELEQEMLYEIGTVAHIRQVIALPENVLRVMVEGISRGRVLDLEQKTPFLMTEVEMVSSVASPLDVKVESLLRGVCDLFGTYCIQCHSEHTTLHLLLQDSDDCGYVADQIAQAMVMREKDKQALLQELDEYRRLQMVETYLLREIDILHLELELETMTQDKLSQNQREYYLREQMKVIQQELGEDEHLEIEALREEILALGLEKKSEEKLLGEVKRLSRMSGTSSESAVVRQYLEIALDVPWNILSDSQVSVAVARKQLEKNHFGLEKVKERILEFLAVRQLSPTLKGQVICLVGPPGVGKTSIAQSIAEALGREFSRISLGGVRDETEIRGHRKTYVGAMPGRVIEALRRVKCRNPVILLDELDKMSSDHRGDPMAALLEVLDTEQQETFRDHYLELPVDLSQVLFIATANTASTIGKPLLDRMEVIEVPSYTDEEKLQIGKKYLLPKELEKHGMVKAQMKVADGAIREMITGYTHESGVRQLQRQFGKLCRKSAMALVGEEAEQVRIGEKNLVEFLGERRFHSQKYSLKKRVGVVNGLAWTSVGGELLEVEVSVLAGNGKIQLTGNLGDVMKESAQTAVSLIRSRWKKLGIPKNFYEKNDIHVHFPEGGIPKDGPSAGIAITTGIVSALLNQSVRGAVAMTGEVSLRGRVLAIGGLREKSMAALRNGVKMVLIPKENLKDLEEIDQVVRNKLEFIPVETIDEVLDVVLFYEKASKKRVESEELEEMEDSV